MRTNQKGARTTHNRAAAPLNAADHPVGAFMRTKLSTSKRQSDVFVNLQFPHEVAGTGVIHTTDR